MRGRLTSSHFVGRVGELAELELASRDAAGGRPVLVLLGGESGVGKTRLVAEFEQRLGDSVVLRGEGVEQGDAELPYAPLLGALRPLVRARHPAIDALSAGSRSQLATLLPGLGQAEHGGNDQSGQVRLFEALLELLDLLSDSQPVVLILEDMHWADRSTRTFAAFLARTLRHERVMMLLTYRTDELHRRHALRPLLAELERLERARRLELDPFDRAELAEALGDILGERPSEQLIERLFMRSEGNPLYTEELLAAGLDGRGTAPQSLRDAFMLRIERLPPDARLAARAVAVGRRLDDATIAQVTGLEGDGLNTALREAVAEQVLLTGEDDRFQFRHALLREALYDDLLPGERAELHHLIASTLERGCGEDDDRELERTTAVASHYAAAGDQPAALRATARAAVAAQGAYAFGEAADLAERALELWPRVDDAAEMLGMDHVELLALAARAHMGGGDPGRAESLRREALRELDSEREPVRYATLLGYLARTQWSLNRGQEGVASAERALAVLPSEGSDRERAWLLGWLARVRFLRGRFREAIANGNQALELAVQSNDADAESEVLNTLGMAGIALGDVDEGVACLHRALELARASGDQDGAAYVYANLADMLNIAGRTADALATAQEGLAAIPSRLRDNYDWLTLTVSELAFESGDWELARSNLVSADARLLGRQLIYALLREAEQALGEGEDERAASALEAAQPLVAASSEPQWIGSFGTLHADLLRRRGELEAARGAVGDALDRIELCTDDVMRLARVTAVGMAVEADMAQRARDLRERQLERDAIARARIHVQRLRAAAQSGGPVERAWRATGEAGLTRARGKNDPALWRKVAAEWEALGRPYQAAIARWREADAHVEAGDRAAAQEAAAAALAVAQELGAGWLAGELTGLASRARLELWAAPDDTRTPGAEAPEDPFGLTARERQVLALVAEGATNRQIGAALFMAEKTASVHVSRILSKLGVQSRTQAAALAHRQHLA
jgi:DNA-binding CsgD family transcriptional regulator/tetratricopeptide (TPR) repeat protein